LDNPKTFLQDQKDQIEKTITQLESTLARYEDDEPRADGQREQLSTQQRHLQLLDDLLAAIDDDNEDMTAKVAVNKRLITVREQHDTVNERHTDGRRTDAWWRTLRDIEYLEYLQRELHSTTDIEAEQPSMSASLVDRDDAPSVPQT